MKLYVHLYSSDVLDRRLFFSIDDVKSNKRARGSPLPEFMNVKCLVVISSLRRLFSFVDVLIDTIVRHFRTLEHTVIFLSRRSKKRGVIDFIITIK